MISVHILTKDSEKSIGDVLSSLEGFSEVLIYDTGSKDRTLEIARSFPHVRICEAPFEGFGITHNKATSLSTNDWILAIDSDEVMTPKLKEEILNLKPKKGSVYFLRRKNYFNGKWIRHSGWNPDWVCRLYNRTETAFTDAKVHESVMIKGLNVHRLEGFLIHTSYERIQDFLSKMQSYSTLFSEQSQKSSSLLKAIFHGFFAFFKTYFLKKGFLDGKEGWIIAAYNGHTAYYKYLKLWERGRSLSP